MSAGYSILFVLTLLVTITASSVGAARQPNTPRAVFAEHDPQGRLANTRIRRLGSVRVRSAMYTIYYLNFTNPVSRHGQQRIAIIKNGSAFMGSYQCTLGGGLHDARLTIGADHLTVKVDDLEFVIRFSEQGPTRNTYFCGEGSGWEDSI